MNVLRMANLEVERRVLLIIVLAELGCSLLTTILFEGLSKLFVIAAGFGD